MMGFCLMMRVLNHSPRQEIRPLYNLFTKFSHSSQYLSLSCEFSSTARDQQTQICTGGTGLFSPRRMVMRNPIHFYLDLHGNGMRNFCTSLSRSKKEEITVSFLNRDGETITVKANVGDTFLDTVIDNDVDIDGFGACEGTLACSTCHLIFDEETYETLPEKLDEEEDMLDLAYGLTDTSRLGCQITLTKEMDNLVVTVPEGISDARDV